MKFTLAWAKVAAQNVTLKVATIILAVIAVVELITMTQLALRNPLVIERACYSRPLEIKSAQHTPDEIKAFLFETLQVRFDTTTVSNTEVLSLEEQVSRDKEQAALKQKQMNQKLVVYDVNVSEKEILVIADRIISIGKVKTVLPFSLRATVKTTSRSAANPYGLILSTVSQADDDKDKK